MGNALSEEEQEQILEEAYNLEDPEADKYLNSGTAAPSCQPKHTQKELLNDSLMAQQQQLEDGANGGGGGGGGASANNHGDGGSSEDGMDANNPNNNNNSSSSKMMSAKHRRESSLGEGNNSNSNNSSTNDQEERRKRQHTLQQQQQLQEQEMAAAALQQKKLSYFQMARLGYQELVNAIIRPPRADYKMEALGPPAFTFCGKRFTRTDFTLRTKRGFNLECSHWEPVERVTDRIPVVIYMHGNSSARVEVLPQLSYLLSLGVAVFSFDFAGSGKSDGEYVSLGYYEREDLSCVVAHLRATNVVSTVALWGRSMGAATALMFGDRDPSIACMILDSPFADLTQLAEEMVEKGRDQGIVVPNFVVSVALRMIAGSVKKQANVNIKNISPITHADKCFIPALLVAGEHDDFIKKHHAEAIYDRYAGDKNIIIVEGDHNSPRPKFMFDSASIFLQTCLQIPNSWALPVPPSMNLMCPPWYFEMYQNRNMRTNSHGRNSMNSKSNGSSSSNSNKASSNGGGTQGPPSRSTSGGGGMSSKDGNGGGGASNHNKGGFDGDQMGMTQERQREIQASLFKMLGQADDPMVETKDESTNTQSSSTKSVPAASAIGPSRQSSSSMGQLSKPSSSSSSSSSNGGNIEVVTAIPSDEAV